MSRQSGDCMPYKNQRSVTLPKDVVDDVEDVLKNHKQELRREGIKKISQMFERAWFWYKEQKLPQILEADR